MKPTIKHFDANQEFAIAEGCFIAELSNSSQDPNLSIARARVPPGATTRWHRLIDTTERYVILGGQGRVEIGDQVAAKVVQGDVVLIPPLCRQRISNTGSEDLIFLAICSPRFTPQAYEDIEDEP